MPLLIEYVEERGAYNKTRREWRALEDHLEFITVLQCVNTRRENDKQHILCSALLSYRGMSLVDEVLCRECGPEYIALSSRADLLPREKQSPAPKVKGVGTRGLKTGNPEPATPRGLKFNLCRCHNIYSS